MGVLALLACVLVLLLAGNLVAPSNASQPLSLVSSPKHTTHVFRATPGLGGGPTSGGESVVVWENPEISKSAMDDATGAMLTVDGQLYMWGTLRREHEPTTWRNVPVEAYLPSGETPVDVLVSGEDAVLLSKGGELLFTHREYPSKGTLIASISGGMERSLGPNAGLMPN